jgi:hypothetical protein
MCDIQLLISDMTYSAIVPSLVFEFTKFIQSLPHMELSGQFSETYFCISTQFQQTIMETIHISLRNIFENYCKISNSIKNVVVMAVDEENIFEKKNELSPLSTNSEKNNCVYSVSAKEDPFVEMENCLKELVDLFKNHGSNSDHMNKLVSHYSVTINKIAMAVSRCCSANKDGSEKENETKLLDIVRTTWSLIQITTIPTLYQKNLCDKPKDSN